MYLSSYLERQWSIPTRYESSLSKSLHYSVQNQLIQTQDYGVVQLTIPDLRLSVRDGHSNPYRKVFNITLLGILVLILRYRILID